MIFMFPPSPTAQTTGAYLPTRDYQRSEDRPPDLDLELRHEDVRRISRASSLYQACLRAGWERDDLDMELQLRVLARQGMASRYDPARGSVGKYLTLLLSSIMSNLVKRQKARPKDVAWDERRHAGACLPMLVADDVWDGVVRQAPPVAEAVEGRGPWKAQLMLLRPVRRG